MSSKNGNGWTRGPMRDGVRERRNAETGEVVFEFAFQDHEGKKRWQTVQKGGRREALRLRQLRIAEVKKMKDGLVAAPTKLTLGEVFELWKAGESDEGRTLREQVGQWHKHIESAFGEVEVQKINSQRVLVFEHGLRDKGLSHSTIRNIRITFGKVIGHARFLGLISSNPLRDLADFRRETGKRERRDDDRRTRVFSREETAAILRKASPQVEPIIRLALLTGMRQSEILGLQWRDVNLSENYIDVTVQLSRATRDEPARRVKLKTTNSKRRIGLDAEAKRLLINHKADRMAVGFAGENDWVFGTDGGNSLYYRNVIRGWNRACRLAGVEDAKFHDLRRTHVSILIASGKDVVFVQRRVGHADPTTTLSRYSFLWDGKRQDDELGTTLRWR